MKKLLIHNLSKSILWAQFSIISHIFLSFHRDLSSSGCPLDESYLQEIWLDYILDSGDLLSYHRGESRESDWFAMECVDEMREQLAIKYIETVSIHTEAVEYRLAFRFGFY